MNLRACNTYSLLEEYDMLNQIRSSYLISNLYFILYIGCILCISISNPISYSISKFTYAYNVCSILIREEVAILLIFDA